MTDPRSRVEAALVAFTRTERRRALAGLVRATGSIGIAEDALQDAGVRALELWTRDGTPPDPAAWLVLTARRRAVDLLRREAARAVAVAERGDPAAALQEVEGLAGLDGYPAWSAARAELLRALGRPEEASSALRAARGLPTSDATARHLDGLLAGLERA